MKRINLALLSIVAVVCASPAHAQDKYPSRSVRVMVPFAPGSATDITIRKQQEAEVRESRARIVAAGDDARKRIERNLHDGAQQRLVSLLLQLRAGVLEGAVDELSAAIHELRELARGIHPEALTRRGLAAALRQAAARMPLPVELDIPSERYDEQVEATAYYVVNEALANIGKYAQASTASVRVAREEGRAADQGR